MNLKTTSRRTRRGLRAVAHGFSRRETGLFMSHPSPLQRAAETRSAASPCLSPAKAGSKTLGTSVPTAEARGLRSLRQRRRGCFMAVVRSATRVHQKLPMGSGLPHGSKIRHSEPRPANSQQRTANSEQPRANPNKRTANKRTANKRAANSE